MAEPTPAHARALGDYVSLVRRRWAWIVVCLIGGVACSLVYLNIAETTYVSTSKVLVESNSTETTATGARTNDSVNLDTEAQLVKSAPVSVRAAELLGSDLTPVALSRRVTVTVPPNTTVLDISFAGPTAEEAQRGAETFARAYLETRQEAAQAVLDADVARLEAQIEQTTEQIRDVGVALAALGESPEGAEQAFLVARQDTLSSQLASYNTELAPLSGTSVTPGEIIFEAQLPGAPTTPNPLLLIPSGIMAGLLLGLGLAVWRERTDKRIHGGAEVERLFGLTPLAAVRGRPKSAQVEHDVRALYHSLRANGPDNSEMLLVVGPDATDTAEHLSHDLAVIAARSGASTAYLSQHGSDAGLEPPRATRGLQALRYDELNLIANGEVNAASLRKELHRLRGNNDFVLLGLPNNDPAVDLPILGRYVDMAVVVVRLGTTTRQAVAGVLAGLTKSGVNTVFAVTVEPGRRRMRRKDRPHDAVSAHHGRSRSGRPARALSGHEHGLEGTPRGNSGEGSPSEPDRAAHDEPRSSLRPVSRSSQRSR